ncbi:MAG TPA: NAD(P)H-binding protein [Pseudonocardia sp.]|jgi:uncharacterized protein YbjT (DUF2867 family)|nr:NAD(P)H-binding protein [Pseudonocardia sp.]
MRVVIAGGHGKIALRLERLLAARGDHAVGLIRNPEHVNDVTEAGASAEVIDLEASSVDELAPILRDADAVVFAAGAGPGSGAARKDTVDRGAAVLLADASVAAGVPRYVLVSSTGVDSTPDPGRDEVWLAYLAAKKAAEVEVAERDIKLVVLRPGPLTDEIGAGRVALAPPPVDRLAVTRDDVAAVVLGLLLEPRTDGLVLELMGGEVPIAAALASVLPE